MYSSLFSILQYKQSVIIRVRDVKEIERVKAVDFVLEVPSPLAYRPRSRAIKRPRAGQAGHPSPLRDCVAMERSRGEAVGFQSFRTRVF
jgi:hypothetical protein